MGVGFGPNAVSRASRRRGLLDGGAARQRRAARRAGLGRAASAVLGARRRPLRARRAGAAAPAMGPRPPVLRPLRYADPGEARRARAPLSGLQALGLPARGAGGHGARS